MHLCQMTLHEYLKFDAQTLWSVSGISHVSCSFGKEEKSGEEIVRNEFHIRPTRHGHFKQYMANLPFDSARGTSSSD
jgi:hypothetical protein